MLTELKLTNFRIFDDEVTVRFRPITILIGRNSAGKSSIIKFLLMLQQSLDHGSSQFLTSEGDKVNLGRFSDLKNSLTPKRNLGFEFTAEDIVDQPEFAISDYLEEIEIKRFDKPLYKAGGAISYNPNSNIRRAHYQMVDKSSKRNLIRVLPPILDDSIFWNHPPQPEASESGSPMSDGSGSTEDRLQLVKRLNRQLSQWLAEIVLINFMRHQINSLRHLSPVREESRRVIETSSRPANYVGQTGRFALPHLQEIMSRDSPIREFVLTHLKDVAGIEDVKFDTSSGYAAQALGKNSTTGAEVLIADFGFGVGQCLPVLVQGAIMDPHTTLMVEQPEAQLHPTAQLELGSYFADLWKQRNVASIIETHSDNILLRLRRLIAKGELDHEDVSVAYFTIDEENRNMPIIKNLDIYDDGSMEAGLPMEFFGADIIESLNLGVGM